MTRWVASIAAVFGRGGRGGAELALDLPGLGGIAGARTAGAEAGVEADAGVERGSSGVGMGSVDAGRSAGGPSVGELSLVADMGTDIEPFCRRAGGRGRGAVGALCNITTLGIAPPSLLLMAPAAVRRDCCCFWSSVTDPRPPSVVPRGAIPPE